MAAATLLAPSTTVSGKPAPTRKTVVLIAPRRPPGGARRTVVAVRSHLSDVSARLMVEWIDTLPESFAAQYHRAQKTARLKNATAVFWSDGRSPESLFFYVPGSGSGKLYLRTLTNVGPEGRHEALAIIVRASVTAILAGLPVGLRLNPPGPPPQPLPARPPVVSRPAARSGDYTVGAKHRPATRPARSGRIKIGAAVAYGLDLIASDPAVNHTFDAALTLQVHPNWVIFTGYRVAAPIEANGQLGAIRVRRHPVSAGVRFQWPLKRFRVGGALAVTLDYVTHNTVAPGFVVSPDHNDLLFSVTPFLHADVRIYWNLRFFAAAGAQCFVNNKKYVVLGPASKDPVLKLWAVRPTVLTGLSVDL